MNTTFKAGDKISFLNEKGKGVIITMQNSHRALVLNEDGFEVSVSINEIVPVADKSEYTVDSKAMLEKDEKEITPPKLEYDEVWEVDLHLPEIIDTGREMSDYEKLRYQLKHFRKCMDAALVYRINKIIFIHGVGKGTLKQELMHALKDYDRVRFFDAPFKRYGYGALSVEILSR